MVGITDDGIVACLDCGCVHDDATALVAQLRADVENLERELRTKRSKIKQLQGDAAHKAQSSPHYQTALRVLSFWKHICLPSAKELNGKRLENCIARLCGGYNENSLNESVLGYSQYPYIVDRRRSAMGEPHEWAADAEMIFRSAKFVDAGIRLSKSHNVQIPLSVLAQIPYRQVQRANRRAILEFLTDTYGQLLEDGGFYQSPCPRCNNAVAPLWIAPDGYSWLAVCKSCGLNEDAILALIKDPASRPVAGQLGLV
jgi:hypothetical protein